MEALRSAGLGRSEAEVLALYEETRADAAVRVGFVRRQPSVDERVNGII